MRFNQSLLDNMMHQFCNIIQVGSVNEYREEYEPISLSTADSRGRDGTDLP